MVNFHLVFAMLRNPSQKITGECSIVICCACASPSEKEKVENKKEEEEEGN